MVKNLGGISGALVLVLFGGAFITALVPTLLGASSSLILALVGLVLGLITVKGGEERKTVILASIALAVIAIGGIQVFSAIPFVVGFFTNLFAAIAAFAMVAVLIELYEAFKK